MLPLLIEIDIRQDPVKTTKLAIIRNVGRIAADDLTVDFVQYQVPPDWWNRQRPEINSFTHPGGTERNYLSNVAERLGPGETKEFDLKDVSFIKFFPFAMAPEEIDQKTTLHYCLRFTFRDSRTGQKYASYKVVSAVVPGLHHWEGAAFGGRPGSIPGWGLPEALIEHAKTLYYDGVKNYESS